MNQVTKVDTGEPFSGSCALHHFALYDFASHHLGGTLLLESSLLQGGGFVGTSPAEYFHSPVGASRAGDIDQGAHFIQFIFEARSVILGKAKFYQAIRIAVGRS